MLVRPLFSGPVRVSNITEGYLAALTQRLHDDGIPVHELGREIYTPHKDPNQKAFSVTLAPQNTSTPVSPPETATIPSVRLIGGRNRSLMNSKTPNSPRPGRIAPPTPYNAIKALLEA